MDNKISQIKANARSDFIRFSKMHLWYKDLPLGGANFIIFPWKGEQPKNYINPEVSDSEGYHWHVWDVDRIDEIPLNGLGKDVIMRRLVTFNCFLWGVEDTIKEDRFDRVCRGWYILNRRYPDIKKHLIGKHHLSFKLEDMVLLESHRQIERAIRKAVEIVDELTSRCPEWIGLPPLSASDPTNQICRDNLKRDFSSKMVEVEGVKVLQIRRHLSDPNPKAHSPLPRRKNIINRSFTPKKSRLPKRRSLRDITEALFLKSSEKGKKSAF